MKNVLRVSAALSLPLDAVTQTVGILGKRGAGKTNTAVVLAEEMIGAGLPNVIVDPVGVWWGLRSSKDGQRKGLPIYIFGGEQGDIPLEETAGQIVADFIVETRQPVVLDVSSFSKSAARRFMSDFSERVYRQNREALHLTIDEADTFIPQRVEHGAERLVGAINDIVRRGRARGLGVTLISQRPALINKDVLTQIEVLIAHRLTGPQDRDAIERWVEHHADDDQAREVLASLASLEDGDAWVWSPGWLSIFKRLHIRERTTFDSSATPRVGEHRQMPSVVARADLEVLRERMSETVERARADDPRELRRQIEELQLELRQAKAAAAPLTPIAKEQLEQLTKLALALAETVRSVQTSLDGVGLKGDTVPSAPVGKTVSRLWQHSPLHVATNGHHQEEAISLRAGERRMLDTLVRHHPVRLTRSQLGTIAGFSASGGTFGTYLGRLKRRGLVDERDDGLQVTPEGLREGGGAPARPQTTKEIVETWRRALRAGERRMLDALIAARPRALTRAELGRSTGYEARGGTFGTYLGTLRRNGLADVAGDEVRVSEALFIATVVG